MKLVTFQRGRSRPRAGALIDGDRKILDLQAAHRLDRDRSSPMLASVLAMAQAGPDALDLARALIRKRARLKDAIVAREGSALLAPIPQPPQMRDFLCFEKHLLQAFATARRVRAAGSPDPDAAIREMEAKGILAIPQAWYERPMFYHPNRLNVVGDGTDIQWPAFSSMLDFELEFGCFIGQPGRDIPKEKARDHIFGYTIFNDVSARDEQMKEMPGQLGPGKGKDFDTGNGMGPWLVTRDELGDPRTLTLSLHVNGKQVSESSGAGMVWTFPEMLSYLSLGQTVLPGQVISGGCYAGGSAMDLGLVLAPGDRIEFRISRIGSLRCTIGQPPARPWQPR